VSISDVNHIEPVDVEPIPIRDVLVANEDLEPLDDLAAIPAVAD
jgi:hypothetical protein